MPIVTPISPPCIERPRAGNVDPQTARSDSAAMALGNLDGALRSSVSEKALDVERVLRAYGISPLTGFMPEEEPLRRLLCYAPWEETLDNLSALLMSNLLRIHIEQSLPHLSVDQLKTEPEWRRAFLVLSLISHVYIWGKHPSSSIVSTASTTTGSGNVSGVDKAADTALQARNTLPAQLAVPFAATARHLGLRPVVCYAAVDLWNWRKMFTDQPPSLNNMTILHTFSGSMDEQWFYLVPNAIELEGAVALTGMVQCWQWMRELSHSCNNAPQAIDKITAFLHQLEIVINNCTRILHNMYDHCDPYVFYNQVRHYVAGWSLVEGGVHYEGLKSEEHPDNGDLPVPRGWLVGGGQDVDVDIKNDPIINNRQPINPSSYKDGVHLTANFLFSGASAAQSSMIQAFDVFLGVQHHPTGHGPASVNYTPLHPGASPTNPSARSPNFIHEMRYYMPRMHRQFLYDVERGQGLMGDIPSVRDFTRDSSSVELKEAYNCAVQAVRAFRDKHIQIVTRYIIMQRQKPKPSTKPSRQPSPYLSTTTPPSSIESTLNNTAVSVESKYFGSVIDILEPTSTRNNPSNPLLPVTYINAIDKDDKCVESITPPVDKSLAYDFTTKNDNMTDKNNTIIAQPVGYIGNGYSQSPTNTLQEFIDRIARPSSATDALIPSVHSSTIKPIVQRTATIPVTAPSIIPVRPVVNRTNSSVNLLKGGHQSDCNGNVNGNDSEVKGTGGTDLIPFLKQSRDETALTRL